MDNEKSLDELLENAGVPFPEITQQEVDDSMRQIEENLRGQ